jgi:PAS domain-containing protein
MAPQQQPLELILARNLVQNISTPALIADVEGALVFYNEAAGQIIGRRFEEAGRLSQDRWRAALSPPDGKDTAENADTLSQALSGNAPGHGRFYIRAYDDREVEVEASAIPLTRDADLHGTLVAFWPVGGPSEASDGG